jgi:hypothetical protein
MMRKFYVEYSEEDDLWDIMENEGGQEHGDFYDTLMFSVISEQDALLAIRLLQELQQGENK